VHAGASGATGAGGVEVLGSLGSLADVVRRRGAGLRDRVAYVAPTRTWSYADLHAESNRVAQGFLAAGVRRGDSVACLTKHGAECALLLFAAGKIGAVLAPLNWRLSARELEYVLGVGRPKVLVADSFMAATLAQVPTQPGTVRLVTDEPTGEGAFRRWMAGFPDLDPGVEPAIEDVAARLFSSGTTGFPKAVDLTHRGFLTQCIEWTGPFRYVHGATTHLNVLPTFHVSGVVNAVWTVYLGGTSVFYPEFDAKRYLAAIAQHRVTDAFVVPAMLRTLVELPEIHTTNLSSLRSIAYGGSPIDEGLLVKCLERFGCGFLQVYGMTEGNGTLTALLPEEHDPGGPRAHLLRSVGRPGPHIELRITHPASGEPCSEGEVGEIWIRSRQLMREYYNDAAATAAAFPRGREPRGGWFRSGDAGYIQDGYLYLFDRIKDMIISGGENIYPAEVEMTLAAHAAVADLAVIGVPDEKWGETVKACIVLRPGATATAAELIGYARSRLAHYKCPTSIDFVDALPRNPSGKILKRVLREPYWAGRTRNIA
jgi:acyl-CoA synthetase (AMP-forming)/AMP-acid ligase II